MADKIIENNQVSITGKIVTGFTFSHQVFGEGFYTMDILVKRLSDSEDRIPVMVSERLVDVTQDYVGEYVEIHGQFRSYNRHEEKTQPSGALSICKGTEISGGRGGYSTCKPDFSGWLYLQTSGIPENTSGKRKSQISFWL